MPEEPHKILLDRDLYSVLIKEHFSDSLSLLEEMVNYGSNLVPRCFVSSEKKISDVVIVLNFLKQAVSLLDSIHILAAKGSTVPCFISLRSLFEISVYLDWIFQKDTEKRGSLYFVWHRRKKLYWALSVKKGTPEHETHKKHMANSSTGAELKGVDEKLIDAQISLLKNQLSMPEFSAINQEFEKLKNRLKDREWYLPGGVGNFREMAKTVKREHEYKVFYSSFSAITHGLAFDEQVSFSNETVFFEPIRNLTRIDEVFRNAFNFAMGIYRSALTHYRPAELATFNKKYVNEWRQRFLSVKKVEYKNGTYTIQGQDLSKLTSHPIKI
jgi:hypothetical protein